MAECTDCDGCEGGSCTKKVSEQCSECVLKNQKIAKEKFLAGLELIRKDKWNDALKNYRGSASVETKFKRVYAKQAELLQAAVMHRALLEKPHLSADDIKAIKNCWRYCITRNAMTPAMAIAEKLNTVVKTHETKELLAETYMLSSENQKAYDVLTAMTFDSMTQGARMTYGIVSARLGMKDEASKIMDGLDMSKIPANLRYKYAMLLAAAGKSSEAIEMLKMILEGQCGLGAKRMKFQIEKTPDFESLKSSAEYKKLFTTGENDCNSCPNRDKCSQSSRRLGYAEFSIVFKGG